MSLRPINLNEHGPSVLRLIDILRVLTHKAGGELVITDTDFFESFGAEETLKVAFIPDAIYGQKLTIIPVIEGTIPYVLYTEEQAPELGGVDASEIDSQDQT